MSAQQPMKADPISTVAFNQAVAEHADGLKNYAARMLQDSVLDVHATTFGVFLLATDGFRVAEVVWKFFRPFFEHVLIMF